MVRSGPRSKFEIYFASIGSNGMGKHLRRRRFVDRNVQGRLVQLLLRTWAVSIGTVGGLTVIGWLFITPGISGFVGPNSMMITILPMVVVGACAALLVLPLLAWDMVRQSHRFVGPMVRFRRHLREAADGGPLKPLEFRDGDDWHELAEAYNDLVARIESERKTRTAGSTERATASTSAPETLDDFAVEESSVVVATAVGGSSVESVSPVAH